MSTAYPNSTDSFSVPTSASTLDNPSHSSQHVNANDAIVAIQTKLGTGASASTAGTVLRGTATGTSAWGAVVLTTDVTGTLPVANGGTGITSLGTNVATFLGTALGSSVATFLATPSSANLATAVTDETGSGGALVFASSPTITGTLNVTGAIAATTTITSAGATSGIGYAAGAGGTVTQITSKSTGVTLSKVSGAITMNNAALAAGTIVSFVLTNTAIAATDVLILNHISGGTPGSYTLNARAAAGSATIDVRNNTAGSLSEAIVIQFVVIKAVNA